MIFFKSTLLSIFVFFLFSSCAGKETKSNTVNSGVADSLRTFVLPEIPSSLTIPDERMTYLALHFFDKFDAKDTTLLNLPKVTEQGVVDFLGLVIGAPEDLKNKAIFNAFQKVSVEPKMFALIWGIFDHYLRSMDSPMRDEETYIAVCENIGKLPVIDEVVSSDAAFNLKQALKNRLGTEAANFQFTLQSGKQMQLTDLKGKYTILMFYEPDCYTCVEAKDFFRQSDYIEKQISESNLNFLAFFPRNDKATWLAHLKDCSGKWINAYDSKGDFMQKEPYFIQGFPTLYLLDKEQKIVLKNVKIEPLMEFLQQNL